MRRLANLFLILFIVSALSGSAQILAQHFELFPVMTTFHRIVWSACLVSGFFVYIGFGFNRHLPGLVLVPLLVWLLWSLVAYWPLDLLNGGWGRLCAYVAQLVFGMLLLKVNFLLNGRSLLLVPGQFAGPSFRVRRLIGFCLISLLVVPVTLALVLFSAAGSLLTNSTGGFVRLKLDGLYMTERIYHQGDKEIRLAGMIHMGRKSYYDHLIASIPAERTVILAEGVGDEKGLMQQTFSYGQVAGMLGLSSQEQFPFGGRRISRAELALPYRERYDGPHILGADIDLQQFDPRTVEVLNALAKYVLNAESPIAGYFEFNRWMQQHMTIDINRVVMNDLIDKRNQAVVAVMAQALQRYDTLVIPWGALHMKGIEAAVLDADFYPVESIERQSINFFDLPFERLWTQLRNSGRD